MTVKGRGRIVGVTGKIAVLEVLRGIVEVGY